MHMKNKIAQTALVVLFAVGLIVNVASPAYADDHSCSLARAAGTYGVSDSGTVIGIGPRAAVALLTLDGAGNITGSVTASLNGSVSTGTLSGTYTVNSECTGSTTFEEYDSSGNLDISATVALVWDADMREFRFLFTSATLPNGTALATVINGDARKR
jgi:hypothetical protein